MRKLVFALNFPATTSWITGVQCKPSSSINECYGDVTPTKNVMSGWTSVTGLFQENNQYNKPIHTAIAKATMPRLGTAVSGKA